MSFFKRLKPIGGSMVLEIDKAGLRDNAALSGSVVVNSKEEFTADELMVDLAISETYVEKFKRPVTREKSLEVGGFKLPVKKKETRMEEFTQEKERELHKETVRIAGPVNIKVGENRFPFNTKIPKLTPTTPTSQVSLSLKSFMKIPKRPDMSHETLLPFQLEAQAAVRRPGVILDEKFENVSEEMRTVVLSSDQNVHIHVKVESGGPFDLTIGGPDEEVVKSENHISREAEFDLTVPKDGAYVFHLLGETGTVRLEVSSKP